MDNELGEGKHIGIFLDAVSYLNKSMIIHVYIRWYMYTYEFLDLWSGLSEWVANEGRDLFPVWVVVFNPRRQVESITFEDILDKSWLDIQLMGVKAHTSMWLRGISPLYALMFVDSKTAMA